MGSESCAQFEDGITSSELDCLPGDIDTKRTGPFTFTSVVTAAEERCRGCRVLEFAVNTYIDEG
jgi:hypothetical protein